MIIAGDRFPATGSLAKSWRSSNQFEPRQPADRNHGVEENRCLDVFGDRRLRSTSRFFYPGKVQRPRTPGASRPFHAELFNRDSEMIYRTERGETRQLRTNATYEGYFLPVRLVREPRSFREAILVRRERRRRLVSRCVQGW